MLLASAVVAWPVHTMAQTEEPGSFRITGISGNVSLRYRLDDETVDGDTQRQGAFEEEVFVVITSYSIHYTKLYDTRCKQADQE